jgi:hypothetical protein
VPCTVVFHEDACTASITCGMVPMPCSVFGHAELRVCCVVVSVRVVGSNFLVKFLGDALKPGVPHLLFLGTFLLVPTTSF